MPEKTFCIIKPDGVARGLTGQILERIENAGLKIEAKKELTLSAEQAAELYKPHCGKKFYPGLIKFMTSGPIVACKISGDEAISRLRKVMGDTDPLAAERGTIRGDLKEANVLTEEGSIKNLIHGSDSQESVERESSIFFN